MIYGLVNSALFQEQTNFIGKADQKSVGYIITVSSHHDERISHEQIVSTFVQCSKIVRSTEKKGRKN